VRIPSLRETILALMIRLGDSRTLAIVAICQLAKLSTWQRFKIGKDFFWRNRKVSNLRNEFSYHNAQQDGQQHFRKRLAIINVGGDLGSIERTIHLENDDG
jgi:hypothetical protein